MSPPNHSFVAELDCCTDDVIVLLKEYNEINNQTKNADSDLLYEGDVQHAFDTSQSTAGNNVAADDVKQKTSMQDECEWDM